MTFAPRALFFTSAAQRVALARQRYFEEGQVPSGAVNSAVLDSWARCRRLRFSPRDTLEFNLVSPSRIQLALQRNHQLLDAWKHELPEIERALAGTSCSAILTDASGVLIASAGRGSGLAAITPTAHRVGINLSEESVGTTAPGLVVKTGKVAAVLGGEHYFEGIIPMYCTAAPIHGTNGRLAGVLDISSEGAQFDFDAAAVVSLYATSIENRVLMAQSDEHLVLRLQVSSSLIDTPMTGLAGFNDQGHLAWANGVASRLFGLDVNGSHGLRPVEELLGLNLNRLLSLPREGATPLRLANGLSVWVRAALHAADGVRGVRITTQCPASPPTEHATSTTIAMHQTVDTPLNILPPADNTPTLRELDNDLIQRTVSALNGNISKAAKQLDVSRGLIYRRLRDLKGLSN